MEVVQVEDQKMRKLYSSFLNNFLVSRAGCEATIIFFSTYFSIFCGEGGGTPSVCPPLTFFYEERGLSIKRRNLAGQLKFYCEFGVNSCIM